MRSVFSIHVLIVLLCVTSITFGCRPKSKKEAEKSRLEEQMAEREKQLTFMKKNGEVDWRKRVEAASKALAQAKSDSRWGRKDAALENALEAAKLMPPPSKDFDSSSSARRSQPSGGMPNGENTAQPSGNADARSSQQPNGGAKGDFAGGSGKKTTVGKNSENVTNGSGNTSKGKSGAGGSGVNGNGGDRSSGQVTNASGQVTNAEVEELRQSLESLLKALDGKAGKSKSGLSFERDAIEVR